MIHKAWRNEVENYSKNKQKVRSKKFSRTETAKRHDGHQFPHREPGLWTTLKTTAPTNVGVSPQYTVVGRGLSCMKNKGLCQAHASCSLFLKTVIVVFTWRKTTRRETWRSRIGYSSSNPASVFLALLTLQKYIVLRHCKMHKMYH